MIIIESDRDSCDASFEYPITDEDVNELIETSFADILRIRSIIKWGLQTGAHTGTNNFYIEEEYSLQEFIATKLTPGQQCRVMEHFWAEIDKVRDMFPRPVNTKSARS